MWTSILLWLADKGIALWVWLRKTRRIPPPEELPSARTENLAEFVKILVEQQKWDYAKDGYHLHRPDTSSTYVIRSDISPDSLDAIHWCCHRCAEDGQKVTLEHRGHSKDFNGQLSECFYCRGCERSCFFPLGVLPWDEDPEIPF